MSSQFRSSARKLERTFPAIGNRNQTPDRQAVSLRGASDARSLQEIAASEICPRRVLVDATYTLGSSRRSGIERVVHNLRTHCETLSQEVGADNATLMSHSGHFHEIGPAQQSILNRILTTQSDVLSSLPKLYRQCVEPLVALTGSSKLKTWLLPTRGHMGLFKLPFRYWYRSTLRKMCAAAKTVEPGEGDLLVLPDAYWARKEIWEAVEQARSRGAFAAVVVYDLIPLTHTEFVGQRRTRRFEEYLRQVATHADMILTISQTVRHELEAHLPGLMGESPYCRTICDFPLGAEFPAAQSTCSTNASTSAVAVRPELAALFDGEKADNPYLTVAAFDPRKNHRYLLDAFDLLWQKLEHNESLPQLCLVGRVGGRCEDIIQRIRNHPRLNQQLFAFHDLSDEELQYCYRRCRGVLFPSIVEGYGLPIVEALWHGAMTLASDTAIHREVGGECCRYFDLATPESLVEMLVELEYNPAAGELNSNIARPHSWQESAEIFFRRCLAGYAQAHEAGPVCLPFQHM